jgi:putative membrane protein
MSKSTLWVSGILWLVASLVSAADTAFLRDAGEGGLMEVKLGELAQTHAASQAVKDFGQRMITDHANMNQDVKNLAGEQHVSLPTELSTKNKRVYDRLSRMNGAEFDKAYIEHMLRDHKADAAAFEGEINSGTDAEDKAVAQKALPTIQDHLRMAQELAGKLGVAQ